MENTLFPEIEKVNVKTSKTDLLKPHKTVRLAVSGDVLVTRLETEIIDTVEFQRLRKLKQLGSTYLVFPTAVHTRFDHSLGTLSMATNMISNIEQNRHNDIDEKKIEDEEKLLIRLLALLNDISHIPFGHTIEDECGIFQRHDEDKVRINRFIGPDSNIGKIISLRLGSSVYDRFYSLMTIKKNELDRLGNDLFIYDLVNNTVCADLLDYLKRDCFFCNIPIGLDYRFLNYMYIYTDKEKECKRIAIRLWKKNQTKPRIDLLNELVSLLECRYNLGQIAYFHHTKLISGAMLAGAVYRASIENLLDINQLYEIGDEELIYKLKDCGNKYVKKLILAFESRKLWKQIYEKRRSEIDERQKNDKTIDYLSKFESSFHNDPVNKYNTEVKVCEELQIEDGDFLIYCPSTKMQLKYAEMKVFWNGDYKTLWNCIDEPLIHNKLDLILKAHENLWSVRAFINPIHNKVEGDLELCCENIFEFNTAEKQKIEKRYYDKIVAKIIESDFDVDKANYRDVDLARSDALSVILSDTYSEKNYTLIKKIIKENCLKHNIVEK